MVVFLISSLSETFVSSSHGMDIRKCHPTTYLNTTSMALVTCVVFSMWSYSSGKGSGWGVTHNRADIQKECLSIKNKSTPSNLSTRCCRYWQRIRFGVATKGPITTGFLLYPCNMLSIGQNWAPVLLKSGRLSKYSCSLKVCLTEQTIQTPMKCIQYSKIVKYCPS